MAFWILKSQKVTFLCGKKRLNMLKQKDSFVYKKLNLKQITLDKSVCIIRNLERKIVELI